MPTSQTPLSNRHINLSAKCNHAVHLTKSTVACCDCKVKGRPSLAVCSACVGSTAQQCLHCKQNVRGRSLVHIYHRLIQPTQHHHMVMYARARTHISLSHLCRFGRLTLLWTNRSVLHRRQSKANSRSHSHKASIRNNTNQFCEIQAHQNKPVCAAYVCYASFCQGRASCQFPNYTYDWVLPPPFFLRFLALVLVK